MLKLSSPMVAIVLWMAFGADAYSTPISMKIGRSAFVPRRTTPRMFAQISRSMTMLIETSGGMEELQELTEQADKQTPLAKQARKSPSLFKLAGYASIPVGAALGFSIVPSRRIAAHAVGAIVTGIAGAVGKSRLDALTEESAKPALAQAIVDAGLENVETAQAAVRAVQENFGLSDEDFELLATEIYSIYLQGMVKYAPTAKTAELKELRNLRRVLNMTNLAVGEAHAAAAAGWYRTTCLFTPAEDLEDHDHPDRQACDKLLFLTERALREGKETEEAFLYEFTRVAKAVGVKYSEALDRVADVVEPFYKRALQSTRAKLGTGQVSPDMLERARQTLGVSDETAADMHVAAFNQEVRECLGLPEKGSEEEDEAIQDISKVKFAEGSMERLERLREVLGLTETDAEYEIASEAGTFLQSTALAVMKDVLSKNKTPEEGWEIMDQRRQELLVKEGNIKTMMRSMVMQALGGPLEETNKFAKVNNEAATYENLLDALEAKQALLAILEKSGWTEFDNFDETFCNPWDKKSANGFLSTDERVKIYRIFLTRSIRKADGGKLSDEMYGRIREVQGLLGISDQQAEIQARACFGPELQKALNLATVEIATDYTPELAANMKQQIYAVVENYRLSQDFLRELGASFYNKAVEIISDKSPAGIPTMDQADALAALRDLFKLTEQDVYPAHLEYFGPVYKKAVLEAMGSTGVIRPELRGPLEDLQKRLLVSETDTNELFLEAVEEKMVPLVQWIGSEMERTMLSQEQLSRRRGKDVGEDVFQSGKGATGVLGLGAEVNIMSDIMELIDFYNENNISREEEATKIVEKKVVSDDGKVEIVAEEVPIVETVYPVTALGSGAIDDQMAALLYRQFIVGGFTSQGPNAARYEASRATFAGILGLSKEKIDEVNNNIASAVYDNFVSNAMKTKGTLDQQDMMFLANIQGKLGLTAEQGEKMLLQAQKKILSEEINDVMDNPSPEGIKAFREKCNGMGMDLQADVGISIQRLTRMFESEITPGLKSGEINADNADILTEIQESFGIEPEECETMFESLLLRLSKNSLNLIKGELLRGRDENTVDLIKELVRYAAFTGGDLGLEVDEATAYKILNIFDALDFSGDDKETVASNKELLATALGISS